MPPTTSETVPGFWRCGRCGTPNPSASYLTKCLGCGRPIPPFSTAEPAKQAPNHRAVEPTRLHRGRKTLIAAGIYAGFLLASISMIRGLGLGWWLVATLVFMPRWLFVGPLVPLAIGAIRARRARVMALVVLDAGLVLWPLMGFSVPLGRWMSSVPSGSRVRIMSFNQGGVRLDVPKLMRYLERHQIDVICFQELGANPGLDEALVEAGWNSDRDRRVVTRFPIVKDLGRSIDVNKSDSRYTMTLFRSVVRHPDGFEFVVGSVHMPTLRRGFQRLMARDLRAFRLHLEWWDEEAVRLRQLIDESAGTSVLVAGDFNMPSDYGGMASIRSTYPSAYENAGWGYGYTRPTGLPWVRIDHVLASRDWSFTRSWVGPDLGSDHLPVIAEAVFSQGHHQE